MVCTYLCCHIPYFCNSAPNWECFPCGEYHFSVRGNISWLVIVSVLLSVSSFCCIVAKEKKIPNHMSILWHAQAILTLWAVYYFIVYATKCSMWCAGLHYFRNCRMNLKIYSMHDGHSHKYVSCILYVSLFGTLDTPELSAAAVLLHITCVL